MFNLLFVDTETTGIPKDYQAPVTDLKNWPRMVQIAWQQFDSTGRRLAAADHIIKPDGFTIPADAAKIHRITTERARREGRELAAVLDDFARLVSSSRCLVAHNVSFDEKIIGAELLRAKSRCRLDGLTRVCTMKMSAAYCGLPGRYGPKWPKLGELHQRLFREVFEEAHDAGVDLKATVQCFWELLRRGVITPEALGGGPGPVGASLREAVSASPAAELRG